MVQKLCRSRTVFALNRLNCWIVWIWIVWIVRIVESFVRWIVWIVESFKNRLRVESFELLNRSNRSDRWIVQIAKCLFKSFELLKTVWSFKSLELVSLKRFLNAVRISPPECSENPSSGMQWESVQKHKTTGLQWESLQKEIVRVPPNENSSKFKYQTYDKNDERNKPQSRHRYDTNNDWWVHRDF